MLEKLKININAIRSWIVAVLAHLLFLWAVFFVIQHGYQSIPESVEVGVLLNSEFEKISKEAFKENPPKEIKSSNKKDEKLKPAADEKKTVRETGKTTESKGGSTEGFKNGDNDSKIKTGGSGEGYGIGTGNKESTEDNVYRVAVDAMPEPFGGISAIQSKVKIPASLSGVKGSVYIHCFIDEDGNVRRAQITKGFNPEIDSAVLAVVKKSKFKAGKDKGKTVKVQMVVNVPI